MSAPALLLLAPGRPEPRAARIGQRLAHRVARLRPTLQVRSGFAEASEHDLVADLVAAGFEEVVVVPLLLSDAFGAHHQIEACMARLSRTFPGTRFAASRPIGPELALLSIVDRRLRDALRSRHVSELDALVFAAAGSADVRGNALVARRARQWATHHRLPCVAAFATGSGPSAAEAVRTLRAQGRRHLAVGSWFLAPSELWVGQAELAAEAGAVAVAEPMGAEPEVAEVVLTRYVVSAIDLVDVEAPSVPAGSVGAEQEPETFDVPIPRHLSVVGA